MRPADARSTIVDLRDRSERERHPSPYAGSDRYAAVDLETTGIDGGYGTLAETYVAILAQRADRLAAAVDAIAGADGCAVVHCHAGRDRTGLVVAIVLDALGVVRDSIMADYLRSPSTAPERSRSVGPLLMRAHASALATDISAALAYLDDRGGTGAYLQAAGLEIGRLDRVRLAFTR